MKTEKQMTIDEAVTFFSSCSTTEKLEFLAGLSFELTVVARLSYEVGGEGLTEPHRVRQINEVQHRITSFLSALLRDDTRRYPDDVLMNIILSHTDDATLEQQLSEAFTRTVALQHTSVA